MSDLLSIIPDFPVTPHHNTLLSLERQDITTSDILTLEQLDIAKRASISLSDLRTLTKEVVKALHPNSELSHGTGGKECTITGLRPVVGSFGMSGFNAWEIQRYISTGDSNLDLALNGGIMCGGITEIVGESGSGKTQLLLQLCCVIQLPPSLGGLSKTAVYISTEAPLSTIRLVQLLTSFKSRFAEYITSSGELSTDHVLSITCGDLESQEHILNYQLPVVVAKHNVGLIVVDSVAANFRAEYDHTPSTISTNATPSQKRKTGPALLAERGKQLVKMAHILRNLARVYNIAVVVANQVSDRFEDATRPPISISGGEMTLDHQTRWFTGWGDERDQPCTGDKKMPALGLVWTNCIGARIALLKTVWRYDSNQLDSDSSWKRWMKVVFMPWAESGRTTCYVIESDGVKGVAETCEEKTIDTSTRL